MAIVHLGAKRLQGTKLDRVVDSLGSSADGTNNGITLLNMNNYATFNGSSSYITTSGTQSDTDFQANESFSVAFWFNSSDSGGAAFIDRWGTQNGGGNNGWLILKDSGTACSFRLSSNWGANPQAAIRVVSSSNSAFGDGKWHHLAVTYGGSGHTSVKIYIDGAEDTGASANITGTVGSITYGLPLEIGAYSSTHSDKYDGSMKQVLIYDDVITSSEVTTLYNSGTPVTNPSTSNLVARYDLGTDANDSQGSINGTATNITFVSDAIKLGSGSYSFDGSNDYVSFGSASDWKFLHDGTSNTVAFWVKRNGTQAANEPCVIDTQGASASYKGISFYWSNNSAGTLTYAVSDGSGSDTKSVVCGDFTDGQWHHVAVTYDGSNITSYKDGTQNAQTSLSGHTPSTADPSYTLHAGRNTRGSTYYKGDVDDIGIYKRALTTTEINKLVNNNVSGASGWSKTSSNINIQNSRVDFDTTSGGSSTSALSYDIGTANIAGTWVLRGKSVITNYTVGGDGSSCHLFVGFSDKDHTTAFDGSQDSLSFAIGAGTNDDNYYIGSSNDGAMYSGSNHTNAQTTHEPTEETLYWELKRTGTQAATLTLYTDSGYSTSPSGYSKSITSFGGTPTNFRYLVFKSRDRSVSGSDCIGYIDDLKFWNDTTSASGDPDNTFEFTAGDAQLVSSLSNKANLKAHYTMDSTSLGATAIFTPDDDYASASGWTDVDTGGDIAIDTSNKGVTYTDVNVGDSGIGKSLGKTLSNSKWLVQFTFQIADWNTNDAGLVSLTSDHTQGFKVSGLKTINFMPQGTPLGGNSPSPSYNRFVLMSGQTNSYAEKASPNDKFVANTQYWVDMYRDGSNIKCKVYTNSGRTGTPHWESDNLPIGTNLDGLTGIQHWNENAADIDIGTGWVREVKVYDGVTSTDGCKNDASSTSDLHAMTNLPTNTIFEQTDDTPSYWWKQSDNTWKKDPKATVEENFSSSSGWTLSNSAISNNSITCTGSGESYKAITGIGKPDKLTWDFTWTRNSGDAGDTSAFLLTNHTGGYSDPSSGQTNVQFYMPNGNATWLSVRKNSGSGNVQTECSLSSGIQVSGTTKYYRITKDGTLWTVKRFGSASDREGNSNVEDSATATMSSSAVSTWNTGSGDLTYILVDGHGSQAKNYTISDVKIWKDVAL